MRKRVGKRTHRWQCLCACAITLLVGMISAFVLIGCGNDSSFSRINAPGNGALSDLPFVLSTITISSPHISGGPVMIARGESATVTVSTACAVLTDDAITVTGAPAGVRATGLPVFYDRVAHAPLSGTTFRVPDRQITVTDADGNIIADDYTVTVTFPECTAAVAFTGQSGADANNAYQIDNAAELALMSHLVSTDVSYRDKFYQLTSDIDLGLAESPWSEEMSGGSGTGFPPIGTVSAHFSGTFDCQGHTISNLYVRLQSNNAGLFGVVSNATIQNCRLRNVNVYGNQYVGGLVGQTNTNCSIVNSAVTGLVTGIASDIGGLVGQNAASSSISNSSFVGSVMRVAVLGIENNIGGLVGNNQLSSSITNSYAAVSVSGSSIVNIGGLVGQNSESTISNSYATGNVVGTSAVGGLVGLQVESTITNSYALSSVRAGDGAVAGLFIGSNTALVMNTLQSVDTGVTASYYNSDATLMVGSSAVATKGVGSDTATLVTAKLTGLSVNNLQVAQGAMSGQTYFGWPTATWRFAAGQHPLLIAVACPNRQYADPLPESCTALP